MSFGSRFLRYPDLFPARIAGERAGPHSMALALPGGPYRINGLSADQRHALGGRYERWSAEATSQPSVAIEVFAADAVDFHDLDTMGPEYEIDLEFGTASHRIAALHFMALITPGDPAANVGIWTSETGGDEFMCAIENVLRPLVAHQVLSAGGLLLHSSAVVIRNRCFLFAGQSGAGKSTIAGLALARGHKVLSDDLNCITRDGDGWKACLMPFAGDHQGVADESEYPIAGLFRLVKALEVEAVPLSAGDCFSLLLGAAPYVNTDPHRAHEVETTIAALVDTVPAWRLAFRPDESHWPIIEAL